MKQRSSAQRRLESANPELATVEPTVLAQSLPTPERLNDNGPRTSDELAILGSTVSSHAKKVNRAVNGVDRLRKQVQTVSVKVEGLKKDDDRIASLETRFELASTQPKIDSLTIDLKAAQKDLRDAIDALKTTQASQASDLKVLKYVVNAIAIFAIGAAGSALGPKLLELVSAMLK